jgi:hypothetical protein
VSWRALREPRMPSGATPSAVSPAWKEAAA